MKKHKLSIIEVSEELKISKSTIYYNIRKREEIKNLFKKENNTLCIERKNVNKLKQLLNIVQEEEQEQETRQIEQAEISEIEQIYLKQIEQLEHMNAILKDQIDKKDIEIMKLLEITKNNQVLLLEDIRAEETTKKEPWWRFWAKKKKR